jgi:hypothetical protein
MPGLSRARASEHDAVDVPCAVANGTVTDVRYRSRP